MGDKPLGKKCYGRIMHLPGSRLGSGDHYCNVGQAKIATKKFRDEYDNEIVQEKLDGSNVGVAKINNSIIPLIRSGYKAISSPYKQHKLFAKWVWNNYDRFYYLLNNNERACGEWLAQAHGTRYRLEHEPFVLFDIMTVDFRVCFDILKERAYSQNFIIPHVIHQGSPLSIEKVMEKLGTYGFHGAIDPAEGCIWRVERKIPIVRKDIYGPREWVVDFLVKYVRHDKQDGIYLDGDPIWNWYPKIFGDGLS